MAASSNPEGASGGVASNPAPAPAARPTGGPGPIVLYDGLCGLCNRAVRAVIAADPAALFKFAPLQGAFATSVLARHGYRAGRVLPDSLILVDDAGTDTEVIQVRSDAVLAIASRLPGRRWRRLTWLRFMPRPIRDVAYTLVARARYRIFGRLESCAIPMPRDRHRFL